MNDASWPSTPLAFLRDIAHMLALANQGQLQLNGQGHLQIGSVSRLAAGITLTLAKPDPRSEAQAPALSLIVGLAGQCGLVGAVGDSLRLADHAHAWLAQPASRQLAQLRQAWWLEPSCGLRWLPANRRQRSLEGHWRTLIQEVARWVAAQPTDTWTDLSAASTHPAVQDVLCGVREGHTLALVRDALQRQGQAVVRVLLEIALPRLGLIEYRCSGGGEIRPTKEGAAWLSEALVRAELLAHPSDRLSVELSIPAPQLSFPPMSSPAVVIEDVEADALRLAIQPGAPALCTFEIGHFAELVDPGPPSRYSLTWDSLQQGVAWGYSAADVLFLLDRFSGCELSPALVKQVNDWQAEMAVVWCEPGYKLRMASRGVLAAQNRRPTFRSRTEPLASGRDAWLSHTQAYELFRYLRRAGYTLQQATGPEGQASAGPTATLPLALAPDLPLTQLLIVLRTYRQLRRLVPGIAALDLDKLEKALDQALHAEDRAGVERLVESHLVFLRHHLKRPSHADEAGAQSGGPGTQRDDGPDQEGEEGDHSTPNAKQPGEKDVEREEPASGPLNDWVDRLQAAIQADTSLELTYADGKGQTTRRRVHPIHIETRWGRQYVLAYCEMRQDERHFRLDRIVAIEG